MNGIFGKDVDSDEINAYMVENEVPYKIIMRDQIELVPRIVYILNMDTSDGPGTHWVTYYVDVEFGAPNSNSIQYFDPFGMPPPQNLVIAMEKSKLSGISYNATDYQSMSSTACGYFSIFAGINMYLGKYPECLSVFAGTEVNDKIVKSLVV